MTHGRACKLHVYIFHSDLFPSDAWHLAHGETTMRMNERLNSDDELMPSFYESDSPDSKDNSDFLLDFELLVQIHGVLVQILCFNKSVAFSFLALPCTKAYRISPHVHALHECFRPEPLILKVESGVHCEVS